MITSEAIKNYDYGYSLILITIRPLRTPQNINTKVTNRKMVTPPNPGLLYTAYSPCEIPGLKY